MLFQSGSTTVFLGANGGGKSRLGAYIEKQVGSVPTHRIAAQRALQFKHRLDPLDLESAEEKLFYGLSKREHPTLDAAIIANLRHGHRWGNRPETHLLEDYDALLQALFAEERLSAVQYRQKALAGSTEAVPATKLDRLKSIWEHLLPHRTLLVGDGTISVRPVDATTPSASPEVKSGDDNASNIYNAAELSDGERVILYLIGQALLVRPNCLLIVDEPELHVHKTLMTQLWDSIEAVRPDCAFVYITHDLEFAVSRTGAQKFALHGYNSDPIRWDITPVPDVDGALPEEIVCRIVGSRRSVLFVEGDSASPDVGLYRRVYSNHTVIPVGGCEAVIGSVASFRTSTQLHRVRARGLVDRDDRTESQVQYLRELDVFTTPVSEIENLFLLPDVFKALARTLGHEEHAAQDLADRLSKNICAAAASDIDAFAYRHMKRQLDRRLKALNLEGSTPASVREHLQTAIAELDPVALNHEAATRLSTAAEEGDVEKVLSLYDNKALFADAAVLLSMNKKGLQEHIGRMLKAEIGEGFVRSVRARLPELVE
ncbi:MAG TPA: DUF4435 domain-containing protein [Allosphingosinicella sp.]